jgi:hypothetical protein
MSHWTVDMELIRIQSSSNKEAVRYNTLLDLVYFRWCAFRQERSLSSLYAQVIPN